MQQSLLQKLGREDDAYHAVSLIVIEYGPHLTVDDATDDPGDGCDALLEAGVIDLDEDDEGSEEHVEQSKVDEAITNLPLVELPWDWVPADLRPDLFIAEMVRRVIDATPGNLHKTARARRADALPRSTESF